MKRVLLLTLVCAAACLAADDWARLQFLAGRWIGEGGGGPGQGSGGFTFAFDLQGKVLVRKNYAEYPPQNGKPAFRHDDLMIIYREPGTDQVRATYFDSEQHVIQYQVRVSDTEVVLESDRDAPGPRYRQTLTKDGSDRLKIRFEIASPGKDFSTYIDAAARREK